jgi:hypothetical protein
MRLCGRRAGEIAVAAVDIADDGEEKFKPLCTGNLYANIVLYSMTSPIGKFPRTKHSQVYPQPFTFILVRQHHRTPHHS